MINDYFHKLIHLSRVLLIIIEFMICFKNILMKTSTIHLVGNEISLSLTF